MTWLKQSMQENLITIKKMETLQIDEQQARRLYPSAKGELKTLLEDTFGKEALTQDPKDKIKSFDDACAYQDLDPVMSLPYPEPKTDEERVLNCYAKLRIIAKALRQGWEPDWNDGDQKKWWPWFKWENGGFGFSLTGYGHWSTLTVVGSRLCFPTSEMAEYFGRQFLGIHKIVLEA